MTQAPQRNSFMQPSQPCSPKGRSSYQVPPSKRNKKPVISISKTSYTMELSRGSISPRVSLPENYLWIGLDHPSGRKNLSPFLRNIPGPSKRRAVGRESRDKFEKFTSLPKVYHRWHTLTYLYQKRIKTPEYVSTKT